MDKLQAPIVANLDMSKFNQQLEAYIDGAIQQAIEEAHETYNRNIIWGIPPSFYVFWKR
jgi:hypothetical protein